MYSKFPPVFMYILSSPTDAQVIPPVPVICMFLFPVPLFSMFRFITIFSEAFWHLGGILIA